MEKKSPFGILKKYFTKKEFLSLVIACLVLAVVSNLITLTVPKLGANIIDTFSQTQEIEKLYYLIFPLITIVASIIAYLQTYLFAILGEKIGADLRQRLVSKVLSQNYNYLVKENPSKILTVILNDVKNIKGEFVQAVGFSLSAIVMIAGSTILMFSLNPNIALPIVLTVPITVILLMLSLKGKFSLFDKMQGIRDRMNKIINENVKASMLVRVFVSEDCEKEKFKDVNGNYKNLGIEITKIFAIALPVISAIATLSTLIIIYFGGQEAIAGNLTIGEISAFNNYVLLFTMPIVMLGFMFTIIGQAMASLARINSVMEHPNDFVDGKDDLYDIESIDVKEMTLNIDDNTVLSNINFKLEKGQRIGILGLTGSGKTTFLKTLLRALEPTSGEISVNGKRIQDYKVFDLRRLIGFSFQENFLVNDSIYENIRFGRDISKENILKVAKIANVDEFAEKMSDKYDSSTGEKGSNLSGGQKQRIMIARALANNPSLLILDDATSRLDINTEGEIFKNIQKEYPNISIVLVAQRISSIKNCDCIYIFEDGKITDFGTHEHLLKESVVYKEIELAQKNYEE